MTGSLQIGLSTLGAPVGTDATIAHLYLRRVRSDRKRIAGQSSAGGRGICTSYNYSRTWRLMIRDLEPL
jgi:hypothetical protein